MFSSDNGYHMGEHLLTPGKMTAFDSDVRVPLIVAGPGVPAGRTTSRIAENVDLHPTLVQLAGGTPPPRSTDGASSRSCTAQRVPRWRTAALIEHHGPDQNGSDPDHPAAGSGNPTSYEAIRTPNAVYVEYRGRAREYYRIDRDPFERVNVFSPPLAPRAREPARHAHRAGQLPRRGQLLGRRETALGEASSRRSAPRADAEHRRTTCEAAIARGCGDA